MAVFALWAVPAVRDLAARDALARFRTGDEGADLRRPTIRLDDVHFVQHAGDRAVARGRMDAVEVTEDRQVVRMTGIREGRYEGERGGAFRFEAPSAQWLQIGRQLSVDGPLRLTNADLDLRAPELVYSAPQGRLQLAGEVTGRFYGGQVRARDLVATLGDGMWTLGPAVWQGTPPRADDLPVPTRGKWTIRAAGARRLPGNREEWRQAEATDGEIVVKADRLERDVATDVLTATGNVRYHSPESDVLARRATVDRRNRRAVLEGDVSVYVKPEGDQRLQVAELKPLRPILPENLGPGGGAGAGSQAEDPAEREADDEVRRMDTRRKYPLQILAQRVEMVYARGRRSAVATGDPQAWQALSRGRWRHVWAPVARYDRERETLRLEGAPNAPAGSAPSVRVRTSLGDDLRAVWFSTSTAEGEDAWEAEGLSGDVAGDDELDEIRGRDEPPAAPPGGPPREGPGGPPALRGRIGA